MPAVGAALGAGGCGSGSSGWVGDGVAEVWVSLARRVAFMHMPARRSAAEMPV